MNPRVKRRWVDALRSGEREQGRGALRRGDTFCCLGVLCDLAVEEGAVGSERHCHDYYIYGEVGQANVLPPEVRRWAGLADESPGVRVDEGDVSLATLNDQGETFNQIANLIEEQL